MHHRVLLPLRAALLAGISLLAMPAAEAQQQPSQIPAPDPASIWTLQDENSSDATGGLKDRFYTNGLRAAWTSGTDVAPAPLVSLGHALWGDGQMRISFEVNQQIFTPSDTKTTTPAPGDRPYAGVLMGTFGIQQDTATSRGFLSLGVGLVGPGAGGEQIQNGFHDLIGQRHAQGWSTQLPNQPLIQLTDGDIWRVSTGSIGPVDTQLLPELTVGVGLLRDYAAFGMTFRVGQGLDQDFGVAHVQQGWSGGDTFTHTRPFAWYVFGGAQLQGVAYDVTMSGEAFRNTQHVNLEPAVGEFEGGVALLIGGARLTYTQVVQTAEFEHQKGGLHQFGSLALSVRF